MKRIIIALVAAVIVASASNSQAIVNSPGSVVPARQPRHPGSRIFGKGTPSKTGPNAGAHILAKPHAAGPAAGPAGGQAANPLLLIDKKKRAANQ